MPAGRGARDLELSTPPDLPFSNPTTSRQQRSGVSTAARPTPEGSSEGIREEAAPIARPASVRPALTSSTEPRTTSDTLCRSSAAVPGLLSARVNFRVSAEPGSRGGGCDILATAASPGAPGAHG